MTKTSTSKQKALSFSELTETRWLANADSTWFEAEYKKYQEDPSSVDVSLADIFAKLNKDTTWAELGVAEPLVARQAGGSQEQAAVVVSHEPSLMSLIEAFRNYGHLQAKTDPLGLQKSFEVEALTLKAHQLDQYGQPIDLKLQGQARLDRVTPAQALERLKSIYCGSIGYEYNYITSPIEREWLSKEIEGYTAIDSTRTKQRILRRLIECDGFEKHLAAQFVGQKRFSSEGADSLIPMLDTLVIASVVQKVKTINIGMAHRARLSVLFNILGKDTSVLAKEFTGQYDETDTSSGDVKYHKGYHAILQTEKGELDIELAFNPSHLEVVNPVVEGVTRAKQDHIQNEQDSYREILPILVHGDAAFAGQGVVMETLQLSQTPAYKTGGTIHIVLNNQVGFTTNPEQARSTRYCTDLGKMLESPVFHVNGDDPEAACRAMDLALAFRNTFNKDVIIDLVCYRRFGHNEGDEPAATQPLMYKTIRAQEPVWKAYAKSLESQNIIEAGEAEQWLSDYRKRVTAGGVVAELFKAVVEPKANTNTKDWRGQTKTAVELGSLKKYVDTLTHLPEGMHLQPQVGKLMADRRKMLEGHLPLNWGTTETLAYATLLDEGVSIRLTGQDAERGTFAHRHAVLHDFQTGDKHIPLAQLSQHRRQLNIYDSILSEMATMGFEYGYATTQENALVIWEAQYGDFVNGAQTVIDQFLTASEQKWGQTNNLVLFLPHGYEGAGPEHSSARLERFLQACAQENIQVCAPTTPAQHFHLLRRQIHRKNFRKPLVIMTPKSLLRHKQATCSLNELSSGQFQAVLDVTNQSKAKEAKRIILCSGKVYYDLMAAHTEKDNTSIVIRLEQLYPFPDQELAEVLARYSHATEIVWCQEEPKNQGPWQWICSRVQMLLTSQHRLRYVGREEAAATAVGSPIRHAAEQKRLVQEALAL